MIIIRWLIHMIKIRSPIVSEYWFWYIQSDQFIAQPYYAQLSSPLPHQLHYTPIHPLPLLLLLPVSLSLSPHVCHVICSGHGALQHCRKGDFQINEKCICAEYQKVMHHKIPAIHVLRKEKKTNPIPLSKYPLFFLIELFFFKRLMSAEFEVQSTQFVVILYILVCQKEFWNSFRI